MICAACVKSVLLFCVMIIMAGTIFADYRPVNGSSVNRTHIMFEWDQVPDAIAYELQLAVDTTAVPFSTNLVATAVDSTLLIIVVENINWATPYIWRVRAINEAGNYGSWGPENRFETIAAPNFVSPLEIDNPDPSGYSPGYTIIMPYPASTTADPYDPPEIMAIDQFGIPIWISRFGFGNAPILKSFIELLDNGNFLASINSTAYEIGIDNTIVWSSNTLEEVDSLRLHHDVFKMPNTNYLAISRVDSNVAITDQWWAHIFPDSQEFVNWYGDRIVEIDYSGDVVWSWNTFDHFSMADYDTSWLYLAQYLGMDWTHANTVFFDELESVIYLSSRHLSRITKIDYPSGNIIWNMGKLMPSGDVDFGWKLDFSYQHGIHVLPSGNLMLFDNGNTGAARRSRALELKILESGGSWEAEIVWQYVLPPELFTDNRGYSGRLENGNTLIVATPERYIGEVNPAGDLVWRVQGALGVAPYRSQRIQTLYPLAYSVIQSAGYPVDNSMELNYRLVNEGTVDAEFYIQLSDGSGGLGLRDSITAQIGESADFSLQGIVADSSAPSGDLTLKVIPKGAPNLSRSYAVSGFFSLVDIREILDSKVAAPQSFELGNSYPNPFNATIKIPYALHRAGHVELGIYDLRGRRIETLKDDNQAAGAHILTWNGSHFPSGIYFVRGSSSGIYVTKKIILLK